MLKGDFDRYPKMTKNNICSLRPIQNLSSELAFRDFLIYDLGSCACFLLLQLPACSAYAKCE